MSMPECESKRASSVAMSAATIGGTSRPLIEVRVTESEANSSSYCT